MFHPGKTAVRQVFGLLLGVSLAGALHAQVVVTGYTKTGDLPGNDDDVSNAVNLGFTINFGGTNYTQTFVSNNGYITFGPNGQSYGNNYSPETLNGTFTGPPIIAAFFADVDTRSDPINAPGFNSGIVEWGTGLVNGRNAFMVKWPSVGEYSFVPNYNSFSLVLVDRGDIAAGNFDVFFNYQQISWDHGAAVAGFSTGAGAPNPSFYELPGSMNAGAFTAGGTNPLALSSNTGTTGGILLQSQGGTFLSPAAITAVPEPSTYALLALGAGLLFVSARRRRA